MAHAIHAPIAFNSLFDGIRRWVAETKENRARWALYNETVAELEIMSNRDLADIGIGRGDITRIAREHAFEG